MTATPQVAAKTRLDVLERRRPTKEDKRGDSGLAYWRGLAGFERRFANLGYIPPGIGAAREASLGGLRRRLERSATRAMRGKSSDGERSAGLSLKKSPKRESNDSLCGRERAERKAPLLSDLVSQGADSHFAIPL